MKKLLLAVMVLATISCSRNEVEDNILNGEWTLINVQCFCGFPDPPDFDMTQIEFKSSQNEVTVTNGGENKYFREDGTYSYRGNENRIIFEDGQSFNFEINGNSLELIFVDQPNISDDEVTYVFVRSNLL